jgi:hypothetical protein
MHLRRLHEITSKHAVPRQRMSQVRMVPCRCAANLHPDRTLDGSGSRAGSPQGQSLRRDHDEIYGMRARKVFSHATYADRIARSARIGLSDRDPIEKGSTSSPTLHCTTCPRRRANISISAGRFSTRKDNVSRFNLGRLHTAASAI